MAAEYSYPVVQTITQGSNTLFLNGTRACKKGFISHREDSGTFRIKGASGGCKAVYRVSFSANIAVAAGGAVEPVTIALQEDGETVNNAVATVTPAAIGDFWNVSLDTFVSIPCGCCVTVSVKNTSATTAIEMRNANIVFTRVA